MLLRMSDRVPRRAGFVIAGGKSTRMGVDKVFLEFEGQTLLERTLGAMNSVCDCVSIVGDPAKFGKHKFDFVIEDIFPDCGPLAGIHAALRHTSSELNLMLAVDMPFVSPELLAFLFELAENNSEIVTVPQLNRRTQPLCGIYRREFADVAEAALRAGRYKIDAVFADVSVKLIDEHALASAGFSERDFFNVNTPEDQIAGESKTS
jgi:molybdopterin-guanine dinucleotide biosynthesis protein A